MSKELSLKFIEKYPKIFSKLEVIDCGLGWEKIIEDMCNHLQAYTDKNEESQPRIFKIEKVHGLMCISSFTDDVPYNEETISKAEQLSEFVCEYTGNPGKLHSKGSELWVVCDEKALELGLTPVNINNLN